MNTYETKYNSLGAGDFPIITEEITIAAGETVTRGNLLVKGDTGYKVATADITVGTTEEGEVVVCCIASEDVKATAETKSIGYFAGEFDADKITLKTGNPATGSIDALRDKSIYLKTVVKSGPAQ